MLLQFSVTNHRSIKNCAVISLGTTSDKSLSNCIITPDNKKEILPVLALYGANAAGKSNLLHALLLMKEMVAGKYAKPLKDSELPQEPFAFSEDSDTPTKFEVIYFYEGIKYAYGFSFDKTHIVEEYLYYWPKGREATLFERENGKYTFKVNIREQKKLANRTPENRLYLVTSNEWNLPQTSKAYLWFTRKLTGLFNSDLEGIEQTLETMSASSENKKKILKEMLIADLGIVDVNVLGSNENRMIQTTHQMILKDGSKKNYHLLLSQESNGTQRFFSRIGAWLNVLNEGGVLVVDEIEASMHPLLTKHLIECMQSKEINTKGAQLIFTTHDVGLLNQTLLRRDQIWFAEKNEQTAETDIYALTEFSPRKDENIMKGYLLGKYGAIPFISGGEMPWGE